MQKSLCILVLLFAVWACQEPRSREQFIGGEGPFVFKVDMSDPEASYSFDLYSRVDGKAPAELALHMRWNSPSDSFFRETVYLPMGKTVYAPYRSGVVPFESGLWTLTVAAPDAASISGFRGLGLVVKKD